MGEKKSELYEKGHLSNNDVIDTVVLIFLIDFVVVIVIQQKIPPIFSFFIYNSFLFSSLKKFGTVTIVHLFAE